MRPIHERVLARSVETDGGCLVYGGPLNNHGYGRLNVGSSRDPKRKQILAHRAVYEAMVGPIPEGMVIDHLCRVRNCVKPEHLEAVTQAENLRRGNRWAEPRTHCSHGHELTPENVKETPSGRRECRTCKRISDAAYRDRRRSALTPGGGA